MRICTMTAKRLFRLGGMPDGKRIQDLNMDDIPRRNSIICDLFSRLNLMERRGRYTIARELT